MSGGQERAFPKVTDSQQDQLWLTVALSHLMLKFITKFLFSLFMLMDQHCEVFILVSFLRIMFDFVDFL